ncbi:MAG: thiamine pyrophosphate-dependent enzyme [Pseudomonadota bacterium]
MHKLLSGNEAIARGAYEAGVKVATAYPGTPSTEIMENVKNYPEIYAEWSPNEKVAIDVAMGASFGGVRAMASMKYAGLFVAGDTFFHLSYLGVKGGLLIVGCDDPGAFSSGGETDTRYLARSAHLPMLEPSDSQEAKDFVGLALQISEDFDTAVYLRSTTRISHCKSVVQFSERKEIESTGFTDYEKFRCIGVGEFSTVGRHGKTFKRLEELALFSEKTALNRIERGDKTVGVIVSGMAYQHAKEVVPSASFLKLGFTYPLPRRLIEEFASEVKTLLVVEELEPFIEEQIRSWGIPVIGKEITPRISELTPGILAEAFSKLKTAKVSSLVSKKVKVVAEPEGVLPRPPFFCAGCPHRGTMYALSKLNTINTGDVGCYGLGLHPPWNILHPEVTMGSSIGIALGIEKAHQTLKDESKKKAITAVIGDSTFYHAGIPELINAVYNKSAITVIILDNATTGMTGCQDHPGTGYTAKKEKTKALDLEELVKVLGVERVRTVDAYDLKSLNAALKEETAIEQLSVVIAKRPCIQLKRESPRPHKIDPDKCTGCGICVKLNCPAISVYPGTAVIKGKEKAVNKGRIDPINCWGCTYCVQVCPKGAVEII